MKIMFASDIHGSAFYCRMMLEAFEREGADRLVILGDLLYHGPRNDLPIEYNPKAVIQMLNEKKQFIDTVRGNCDSEVDQMVLEFPIMADYALILEGKKVIYATHGHVFNEDNLPPLRKGDVIIHGHTHVWRAEKKEDYFLLNPGSVSLPKEGNIPTYGVLENNEFVVKGFSDEVLKSLELV